MSLMALFWTVEIIVWGTLFYHWYFRMQEVEVLRAVVWLSYLGIALATLNIII